jgi:hypothetical protein
MEANEAKNRKALDQAVGTLGVEKAADVLNRYIARQATNAKVREFVREAKKAGKI